MKRFLILATILVLANFCKSAWSQRLETESTEVVLAEFSWEYRNGSEIKNLTICAKTNLVSDQDKYKYTLTYLAANGTFEPNYESGKLSKYDAKCVSFRTRNGHLFTASGVTYSLTVTDINMVPVSHGAAHFAVQTETLSMNCSSPFPLYYRIEAGAGAVFKDCLPLHDAGGNICYRDATDGDISDMNICYTDGNSKPADLTICQTGLKILEENKLVPGNPLQIDYLAYGREGSGNAALKLTLNADMTEVIVVAGPEGANEAAMCSYDNGLCTIDDFTPQNIEYSVCGLATAEDLSQSTSIGKIKDFNVFIYGDTDLMFNFGFVNAHEDRLYRTNLVDKPEGDALVGPVNIDCAKIKPEHNCYGFMLLNELQKEENYLEVSYLNNKTGEETLFNTVIAPYEYVAITTTTTTTTTEEPPPIKKSLQLNNHPN